MVYSWIRSGTCREIACWANPLAALAEILTIGQRPLATPAKYCPLGKTLLLTKFDPNFDAPFNQRFESALIHHIPQLTQTLNRR
jgi:hypothetical protein